MPITFHSFTPFPAPRLSFTLTRTAEWDAASTIQLPRSKQGSCSVSMMLFHHLLGSCWSSVSGFTAVLLSASQAQIYTLVPYRLY